MDAYNKDFFLGSVRKVSSSLFLMLLTGLLVLRIPFLAGLTIILGNPSPDWIEQVFQVGTFLLTAILIWVERDRLDDFHITPLALGIILLFKPLMPVFEFLMGLTKSPFSFPKPLSFIYLFISIGLLIALKFSHWNWQQISSREWKWLGFGAIAGLGLLIIFSFPMAFTIKSHGGNFEITYSDWANSLFIAFLRIPQQLGYAAISEEPLFRGLIWGFLRKSGWKNIWILIFQTILFMVGHVYYFFSAPLSFWIIVPIGGIVFGLLVWRSKSIVSSMACHAVVNAIGYLAGQFVGQLIFR